MMKTIKILSMAVLALVGVIVTGCSSDDGIIDEPKQPENKSNVVTLTTTISMDDNAQTRALAADGTKTFAVGEKLALVYKNTSGNTVKVESAALKATDIAEGNQSATFTFELENPDKTKDVTYIYPAAMAKDDGSVYYRSLELQFGTLSYLASDLDLATYSGAWNGASLPAGTLENQLAILAITLKNESGSSDITSTIIDLTISDGTNSYYVGCSERTSPIYVAIRPTDNANISIEASDGSDIYNYTKFLTGKTYEASNGYNVSWRMTKLPTGAINGKFSVSSTKQVFFSKGNLQAWTNNYGTSWVWSFAEHQYEYIGDNSANKYINGSMTVSTNGTVDLFGWNGNSSSYDNYGINNSTTTTNYGNTRSEALKHDWGHNEIANGGNTADTWRTLTKDEWEYVFKTRSTTSGVRYAKAKVGSAKGVILLPDDWNTSFFTLSSTNTADASYTANTITDSDWDTYLEFHGAVFLPAAGYRSGKIVSSSNSEGYYWSSDSYNANNAYRISFKLSNLNYADNDSRKEGNSVRVVSDVE